MSGLAAAALTSSGLAISIFLYYLNECCCLLLSGGDGFTVLSVSLPLATMVDSGQRGPVRSSLPRAGVLIQPAVSFSHG